VPVVSQGRARPAGASILPKEDAKTMALFMASIEIIVGDGRSALFWTDPWMEGRYLHDSTPNLIATVSARIQRTRTVAVALLDDAGTLEEC
jgi:hypothetical protein